jgi:long-chain fatty acid transport protein
MGRAAALAVIALGAGAAPAAASPVELFGFGSRHGAHAGAGVADVDDMAATWMNPAGLAAGHKALTTGLLGWVSNLRVGERRSPMAQPGGGLFGVTLPAPLGGPLAGRIGLGLGMFVLPTSIVRITARLPDEPFFPYYQGRAERLVIVPGVGVRVTDAIDVGVAANFLAGLGGGIAAGEGATRALEARVDEVVPAVARLVAGVRWRVRGDLAIAAVYRQRFEVPFTTVARTEVAGEPINLDLAASGQFSPHTAVLGATWRPPGGALHLDLQYARWSSYPGPFVKVGSELPLVGPLAAELPAVPWRDTFAARLGGDVALGPRLVGRAGYGFETSPVPAAQPGVTNLLDGPRHTVGLGVAITWPAAVAGKPVTLALHGQAQLIGGRTLAKSILPAGAAGGTFDGLRDEVTDDPQDPATQGAQISNPGYPRLDSGGQVFSGGATLEVGL